MPELLSINCITKYVSLIDNRKILLCSISKSVIPILSFIVRETLPTPFVILCNVFADGLITFKLEHNATPI